MDKSFLLILLTPAFAFSKPVENKVWLKTFTKSFIENFCESPQMKTCYEIMRPPCQETVLGTIKSCASKMKLPESVNLGPESGLLGADIGRCVGREIEPTLKKKKTEDKICKSIL